MTDVSIRFATLDDLPDIRAMWRAMMQELPLTYPTDMCAVETVDEFTREAAHVLSAPNSMTFCLVATDPAGHSIGFHCFGYQSRDLGIPHLIGYCYWIYVVPAYRRTELVEDLAQLAIEHALARGVTHVEMTRPAGQALRRGLGFEAFEIRSYAPLTLVLTRLEERRRRRQARLERRQRAGNGAAREESHDSI